MQQDHDPALDGHRAERPAERFRRNGRLSMRPMSRDELLALPTTTSVESAARALGMGRTRAYDLAKRNQFPCRVIRIGVSYRVVTADLHRLLGLGRFRPRRAVKIRVERTRGVGNPRDGDR